MIIPEISFEEIELILNKLNVRVGDTLVSFNYSKIFIYHSAEFVFKNILKDSKTHRNVNKMLNLFNLFLLPEKYMHGFKISLKHSNLSFITFKEFDIFEKEQKDLFKQECVNYKIQLTKKAELDSIKVKTEEENINNLFNIINNSIKQLSDNGYKIKYSFKYYRTKS